MVKKEKKGGCSRGLSCGICESNLFSRQRTKFVAVTIGTITSDSNYIKALFTLVQCL